MFSIKAIELRGSHAMALEGVSGGTEERVEFIHLTFVLSFIQKPHCREINAYSTRLKELDNLGEAPAAKPFGISTKVFSIICTIWSPTLFKVLEIFRAIHFFSKTFFF